MDLQGKVALVTGASRGIGRQIALELARRHAQTCVHYCRSEDSAREVVDEISRQGGEAIAVTASVREETAVSEMFAGIVERFGKIDIVVLSAGIVKDKPMLRMKAEDFDEVIATNLRGTFLCLKEAGRHMLRSKYGRIVAMSSVVAATGNIGQASYAASKAGIVALVKTFAREFGRWDITANAVAPGLIEAGMSLNLSEEIRAKILSFIPKGRMGTAQEVADLVAFLVSDEARYITGQVYSIDGGMT